MAWQGELGDVPLVSQEKVMLWKGIKAFLLTPSPCSPGPALLLLLACPPTLAGVCPPVSPPGYFKRQRVPSLSCPLPP